MSPRARSARRQPPSISIGPAFDIPEAFRHGLAVREAEKAVRAATPGTPEAEEAMRALAELKVRRLIRWPEEGTKVLLEVAQTGDEQTLRALVRVIEDHYEKARTR